MCGVQALAAADTAGTGVMTPTVLYGVLRRQAGTVSLPEARTHTTWHVQPPQFMDFITPLTDARGTVRYRDVVDECVVWHCIAFPP